MNFVESEIIIGNLKKLEIADKCKVESVLAKGSPNDCENCFSNLFIWTNACGTQTAWWRNRLVAYNAYDSILFYPFGEHTPPHELRELADTFAQKGLLKLNYVYNVPTNYDKIFDSTEKYFKLMSTQDDADYLYDVEKLISLSGAKLRKKRNHIKHFTAQNPDYTVEKISQSNMLEVETFIRAIDDACGLLVEEIAIASALKSFDALGLHGLVLRVKNRIAAVSIFGKISDDTYVVHFEKSDKSVEGAAQMIVQLEAEEIKRLGGKIMNREQDIGDANLRHAKESLDPSMLYMRQRAYLSHE